MSIVDIATLQQVMQTQLAFIFISTKQEKHILLQKTSAHAQLFPKLDTERAEEPAAKPNAATFLLRSSHRTVRMEELSLLNSRVASLDR